MERVRSLCNRSVQRLGLAAYHARKSADTLRGCSKEPFATLIASDLENLAEEAEVSIGDMEETAGSKIGLDTLVSDMLASIKDSVTQAAETPEAQQKLLSAISKPLETFEKQIKDASFSARPLEVVTCPTCKNPVPVRIGESPGSTAKPRCLKCNSDLLVHKVVGGIAVKVVPTLSLLCPQCQNPLNVKFKPSDPNIVIRNCFNCDHRIYINSETGSVQSVEKVDPLSTTYVVDQGKAKFICPSCMYELRLNIHQPEGVVKGSCPRCTHLIRATPEQTSQPVPSS